MYNCGQVLKARHMIYVDVVEEEIMCLVSHCIVILGIMHTRPQLIVQKNHLNLVLCVEGYMSLKGFSI